MRCTGVTVRGIITPIFQQGDNLVKAICKSITDAAKCEKFELNDGDIVSVTEAVVARTQGNYATVEQMGKDIRQKLGGKDMGIVFPILSRNRFGVLLKAMANSCEKLYIQLSYPTDEVGNRFIDIDELDSKNINPFTESFDEKGFRKVFGNNTVHCFTGIDYIEYYKSFGDNIEIVFSNDPKHILKYTKNVLNCDVHSRIRTQRIIKEAGAERSFRLDEILTESVDGSGYNPEYGLLGSNKATESKVKLFPRDTDAFVADLYCELYKATGKQMEVMVYGDGGFKDPVGGIWELADPVISPSYTQGLRGTPNELKMKYFADNELSMLQSDELAMAMKRKIREKQNSPDSKNNSQGTTPRRLTDLLGSLSDLVSGSGDRGTPVVLVQGYFTNFATE